MSLTVNLAAVREEFVRRTTGGSGELLRQVENYVASRSGKMLRPQLTLMAAATMGDDVLNSRRTLLAATCVEMLHNASLIHDDVIDADNIRRGSPSVNARWNNKIAVLVGDFMLAQVMTLLEEMDDDVAARMVNRTVTEMVEAELLALDDEHGSDKRYLRIIDGKTARLFATACALGNPVYETFGLHYGRVFQLRDDIADGEATQWTESLLTKEIETINAIKFKLPVQNI